MRAKMLLALAPLAGCLADTVEDSDHAFGPQVPVDEGRIDRMGRVEITNFMLCFEPFHCDDEQVLAKDRYNAEDAFELSSGSVTSEPQTAPGAAERRAEYARMLEEGLQRWDATDYHPNLDAVDDWPSPHPMLDTLLEDYLLVDVSKPCTVDSPSYLALELAAIAGRPIPPDGACGGRTPNDDTIDRTTTVLVNGPARLGLTRRDGVDRPRSPATNVFPYLSPAHQLGL